MLRAVRKLVCPILHMLAMIQRLWAAGVENESGQPAWGLRLTHDTGQVSKCLCTCLWEVGEGLGHVEATEPVSPLWHKIRPTSPECLHMKASSCITPRGGIMVGHQTHTPGH